MDTTTVKIKRITRLQRLANSDIANPKYRVDFADGTSAETATNSAVVFKIGNSEYREGDVLVTFNHRGSIIDVSLPQASS